LRRTTEVVSSLKTVEVVGTPVLALPEQDEMATIAIPAATARHRPTPRIAPECRCATGRSGSVADRATGQNRAMATELLYLRDAYLRDFDAVVIDRRDDAVALDRTAFYPTGGGQPHDLGTLSGVRVTDVRKEGDFVWHTLDGDGPRVGAAVAGAVDWTRRHALMRTHSALHVLCGVIWNEWRVPVTGGNMEPLAARMDFEFDPLPEGFGPRVEELVNAELAADRPIEIEFLPRDVAVEDEDLIRTKVNMIPESVREIRVVDIVGLDKQADGGTHVRTTGEVGRIRVTKTENKGKGNKRVRLEVVDG
jgi:misacylated tRNA(Ala) deacylase